MRSIFLYAGQPDLRWIAWPFLLWGLMSGLFFLSSPVPLEKAYIYNYWQYVFILVLSVLALATVTQANPIGLLWGLVVAALLAAWHGFYDTVIQGMPRASGLSGFPIRFGNWSMIIAMLLVLFSALSTQMRVRSRICLLALAMLAMFASMASGSRSSLLPLPLLIAMLLIFRKDRFHRWILVIGLMGTILSGVILLNSDTLQQKLRLTEIVQDIQQVKKNNFDTSIGARFGMWEAAWQMFLRHPFIGIGITGYQPELKEMITRGEIPTFRPWSHAHSDMLHSMATRGIVGLLAYLGIILGPLVFFIRCLRHAISTGDAHQRVHAAAGILTIGSVFAFGLVSVVIYKSAFNGMTYALLVCVLAAQLVMARRSETGQPIR
ncbi:membrane spanning protein involved in lipopolysaccharide biosynthesis [Hylemonella gracilis ATCC 19624]|uniref:Membrane spanning protein involved in lipopolysaccharide biosynthesis n=2 Tax=Hylemonella gracilis TaxID=80880 RepID=F3KS20_9BURK|nr:membrane spanning protein involved in lipopolysaccharide biosynthesis [Hylemonella gracilis ATCC 19624]